MNISILFVVFLFAVVVVVVLLLLVLLLVDTHNSKGTLFTCTLYIPNDSHGTGLSLFWFGVAYKLQLVSYVLKTLSKNASRSRLAT